MFNSPMTNDVLQSQDMVTSPVFHGQEFAHSYMDLFSSDEFLAIVKAEKSGHEDLAVLCTGLCSLYCNHDEDFMTGWLRMPQAESPLLQEIADTVDRVHNIARCFMHLLCLELPRGEAETSFLDVQRLSKYAGTASNFVRKCCEMQS